MGSQQFSVLMVGQFKNANEAFNEAQEEANEEYGHQRGYSGAINSVSDYRRIRNAPKFGTIKFWDFVESYEVDKRDCFLIDVTDNITVKHRAHIKSSRGMKGKRNVKMYYFFGEAPC